MITPSQLRLVGGVSLQAVHTQSNFPLGRVVARLSFPVDAVMAEEEEAAFPSSEQGSVRASCKSMGVDKEITARAS